MKLKRLILFVFSVFLVGCAAATRPHRVPYSPYRSTFYSEVGGILTSSDCGTWGISKNDLKPSEDCIYNTFMGEFYSDSGDDEYSSIRADVFVTKESFEISLYKHLDKPVYFDEKAIVQIFAQRNDSRTKIHSFSIDLDTSQIVIVGDDDLFFDLAYGYTVKIYIIIDGETFTFDVDGKGFGEAYKRAFIKNYKPKAEFK